MLPKNNTKLIVILLILLMGMYPPGIIDNAGDKKIIESDTENIGEIIGETIGENIGETIDDKPEQIVSTKQSDNEIITVENKPVKGHLIISSTAEGKLLNSEYKIIQILSDNTEKVVKTGILSNSELDIPLSEGVYYSEISEVNSIKSDPVFIRNNAMERFNAEFNKVVLNPYDFSESEYNSDVQLIAENEIIKEFNLISGNKATFYIRPGVYQLRSIDSMFQKINVDATDSTIIPVHLFRANRFSLDTDASFGRLVVNASTVRSMPLQSVFIRYVKDYVTDCSGNTVTTNSTGIATVNLAPGDYSLCIYKSLTSNSYRLTNITITGATDTALDVSFSHLRVFSSSDDYTTLKNSTSGIAYWSGWLGTDNYTEFFLIAGTYDVIMSSGNTLGIVLDGQDQQSTSYISNLTPSFKVVNYGRVNANQSVLIDIEVTDPDIDPLKFYYSVNLGTLTASSPNWISDRRWGVTLNYTAPIIDNLYQLDLGVQDDDLTFSNYTVYLSNRQSNVTITSTEKDFAGLQTYLVLRDKQTNSIVESKWTLSNGVLDFTNTNGIFDGRYYYELTQANKYTSNILLFNQSSYSYQFNWTRLVFNTTAHWGNYIATTVYAYNNSNSIFQFSTSSSTGIGTVFVVPYSNYTFRVKATNSIWIYSNNLIEATEYRKNVEFGTVSYYGFDDTGPGNRYISLINNSNYIANIWTGTDGIHSFYLAPYNNYSILDNSVNVLFENISVNASIAVTVGNFSNSIPVISAINPTNQRLNPGENMTIEILAFDADPVDILSYNWTTGNGIITGSGSIINYTAPTNAGPYRINVTVYDNFGGNTSTYIYVSNRYSNVTATVTRGESKLINGKIIIRRARDNVNIKDTWVGTDGFIKFTDIYDEIYDIFISFGGTTINYRFVANYSEYNFDFRFADIMFNATTFDNRGISSTIKLLNSETRAYITSITTIPGSGLSINHTIAPGTYDLEVYSNAAKKIYNDVTISANEWKLIDIKYSMLVVNITQSFGNMINSYITLKNGTTNIVSFWIGADGYQEFYTPAGNYSLIMSSTPSYTKYNILVGEYEEIVLDIEFSTFVGYINDGINPQNGAIRFYYANTSTSFYTGYTSTDGVLHTIITPGIYDVNINGMLYEDVEFLAGKRVELGNRINNKPVIEMVDDINIGPSSSVSIDLQVSDVDYDYSSITISIISSAGTVILPSGGYFSSENIFLITFDYFSPATETAYILNITVSDGDASVFFRLFLSSQTNTINLRSERSNNIGQSTTVYIYDKQSGDYISSYVTDTNGEIQFELVDGWYDFEFRETNYIYFRDVIIYNRDILNITASFGDLDVFATASGGVPVNAYTIIRNATSNVVIASVWMGNDGFVNFILAPGLYNIEVQQGTSIFFNVTIFGGLKAIVGSENPVINSYPDDISYQYGSTGNTVIWDFYDSNPYKYYIYYSDNLLESGFWNGGLLTINLDGFDVGDNIVQIWVNDTYGYNQTDYVLVSVFAPPGPYANAPDTVDVLFGYDYLFNWTVSALFPDNYYLYLDGVEVKSGNWANGTIDYLLDKVTGVYNLTILLYDIFAAEFIRTSMITFLEDPVPLITASPDNMTIDFYDNITLEWMVDDNNPSNYYIYLDGSVIQSGTWNDQLDLFIDASDLIIGNSYNYTIIFYDESNNYDVHTVFIGITGDSIDPVISGENSVALYTHESKFLSWNISDSSAYEYSLYIDGVMSFSSSSLLEYQLQYLIEEFASGSYNFTVMVVDRYNNTATFTTIVNISEFINDMSWTAFPENMTIALENVTTLNLIWEVSGSFENYYELYLNDLMIDSSNWTSGELIEFSFSTNIAGMYNFTMIVYNEAGHKIEHSFSIDIFSEIEGPGEQPSLPSPLFMIFLIGLLGLISIFMNKREQLI